MERFSHERGTPVINAHTLLLRRVRSSSPACRMPAYRGTSLIRNTFLLGPYSRSIQDPMVVLGAVSYERGTPVNGSENRRLSYHTSLYRGTSLTRRHTLLQTY